MIALMNAKWVATSSGSNSIKLMKIIIIIIIKLVKDKGHRRLKAYKSIPFNYTGQYSYIA